MPAAATREQLVQHLLRTLYPAPVLQEHLAARVADIIGRKVSQVEADYRNTLTFPMLVSYTVFQEAIHGLVEQGNVIGLRHPAENVCGRRPRLTGDQLADAVISEPFDVTPATSTTPPTTSTAAATRPTTTGTQEIGHGTGSTSSTTPTPAVQTLATTFLNSRQQVRQEIARLLDQQDGCRIVTAKMAFTFDERTLDVGALPTFLRGSLTGTGKFSGEAALEFSGPFTKAQVEEMVERLPDFSPGSCRLTLGVEPAAA